MSRTIDVAEVAKIIRRTLKEAFPSHKFSVRIDRYSMGSSIDVAWIDGPTEGEIDALVRVFEGKRFDGMTDSSSYVTHTYEGESVWFGSDYVHCRRRLSAEFADRAAKKFDALDESARRNFLDSINYKGDIERDRDYLIRAYARGLGEAEQRGSVTATAILLANPFLYEEVE
jgi:hypothetical protein